MTLARADALHNVIVWTHNWNAEPVRGGNCLVFINIVPKHQLPASITPLTPLQQSLSTSLQREIEDEIIGSS